jgi:hypothetical protein
MLAYMAKLDGRKAALALKLAGLVTVISRKMTPILPFKVELVTMYRRVWLRAQARASP